MSVDLPFWLQDGSREPILASVRDAGYADVQTMLENDEVMLVAATGQSGERHVVRCKALRDFADVLSVLDKRERKARLRGGPAVNQETA